MGYWCTLAGRFFTVNELLRLQGFDPARVVLAGSERDMGDLIGNASSKTVAERVLRRLLIAAGLADVS